MFNRTQEVPAFMQEFANYQIAKITEYELMKTNIKQAGIDMVNRAIDLYREGYITVNEAMATIANPFQQEVKE